MFRKIGKNKKEDDVEESNSNWEGADNKPKPDDQNDQSKMKGPKEASVIYNGSKQVNVIVKGATPLAVPKSSSKTESSSVQRNSDPIGSDDGGFTTTNTTDKNGCVEVDLHDDDDMVPDPRPPNWRQQFVKKLQQIHAQRPPKNPHTNIMPPVKKAKINKLPGFLDYTVPPEKLRLEYRFDEWSSDNLNPEYQDPPKTLSPLSYKVQSFGHKYWGETFALIQPVADFAIALFLELLAFVARVTSRLVTGTLLRLTDLLIKPLLVFTFNALILPPFVVLQNILRAFANATSPLFEVLHRAMEVIAVPIAAFRLVEVKHITQYPNPIRNHIPYSQTNTIEREITIEEQPMKSDPVSK